MKEVLASIGIFWFLLALFLLLLWTLLPFAVFGIKSRLDVMIEKQKIANNLLKQIVDAINSAQNPPWS